MAKNENKFNFDKDERVLCYHGPFIYEAKILKREKKEDQDEQEGNQYFVHYKGWKQTQVSTWWDEWVTEDRVLKYTDANLQKQKQLKESNLKRKSSRASVGASATPENASESRSRKRHRDSSIDKAKLDEDCKRPEFKLTIPDALKGLLVDDWENITKNRQILVIPREIVVDKILQDFKEQCMIKDEALEEFIKGAQLYFNKTLVTSLLYRSERKQHEEVCREKEPSSVYGAEHLLRLFVEIPSLISEANIDTDTMAELKERFEDLLRFIQNHEKDYFSNDYSTLTSD
ncbi:MRG-domain-containing protein [Gilbertella persicaria]|uniref:MRG-domain-containing protein n=1 Tax=Gilbertella persicaria TaxID=101096 RepID=UPI00221F53E6|nr:MRG-domain-containing protein [Gilbertella persicaria]KAI8076560.1 MRG-domain-containing protein [Gilbertella persicaria]